MQELSFNMTSLWTSTKEQLQASVLTYIALVFLTIWLLRAKKVQIPGPLKLPILGNLHLIGIHHTRFTAYLVDLYFRYGPVYSFKMGVVNTVVIGGYKTVVEVLTDKHKLFSNRPLIGYLKENKDVRGLFFQNGEEWKCLRQLTLRAFRDVGKSYCPIADIIQTEADDLVACIKSETGPIDPKELIYHSVGNCLGAIVFNERFDYNDKNLTEILKAIDLLFEKDGFGQPENFLPWLKFLKVKSASSEIVDIRRRVASYVKERMKKFNGDQKIDSRINSILQAYSNQTNKSELIGVEAVTSAVSDLLGAGVGSTSTTLLWWILYMIRFPAVRRRCQKDIERVQNLNVSYIELQNELPYVEATIREVQRICSVIPIVAPHETNSNVELAGYHIPKNTMLMVSLESSHKDPEYWTEPSSFRPERFIGPDGRIVGHSAFIPFGRGPRQCIGRTIAKRILFSFAVAILNEFELFIPDGEEMPSLRTVSNIMNEPLKYRVVALSKSAV